MDLDLGRPHPDLPRVLGAAGAGLFAVDPDGRIAGWSEGAARATGLSDREVIAEPCSILDRGGAATDVAGLWRRVLEGAPFAEDLVAIRHAAQAHDATVLVDLRRLEEDGRFAGAIGTIVDLTRHLMADRRLARVRAALPATEAIGRIIGESEALRTVLAQIEQAAAIDVTVLIRGETGTGKELAARAVHAASDRRRGPLVCVNCAAIPEALLASELFGHVRGSFTGALRDKKGVFEEARGGIVFLDEIGDLEPTAQVKLLRALQEREIRRVGGDQTISIDVRVVSATNRDLAALVAAGEFREDLYYRLRVFELSMPPLRQRSGDLAVLVPRFIEELAARHDRPVRSIAPEAMACIERYRWPGNVRELRNAIEHAFVTVEGAEIRAENLPPELRGPAIPPAVPGDERGPSMAGHGDDEEAERSRIVAVLRKTGGRKSAAATLLGMSRVTLWKRIKKYGINPQYRV